MDKQELKRIEIISKRPVIPIKQKHSYGNSYNHICGRNCYRIQNLHKWSYCDCIRKARQIESKKKPNIKFIA